MNKTEGFSLTEVLLVLGLIGVVSMMTLPSMDSHNKEREYIISLKKAHNILSQAYDIAENEYGPASGWGWTSNTAQGAISAMDIISTHMNVSKNCKTDKGCFGFGEIYKYLDGSAITIYDNAQDVAKIRLQDGISIALRSDNAYCSEFVGESEPLQNVCGIFVVDINGDKTPNRFGLDTFMFWVTTQGIYPVGGVDDTVYKISECSSRGISCAAWVLQRSNMDYTKKSISW